MLFLSVGMYCVILFNIISTVAVVGEGDVPTGGDGGGGNCTAVVVGCEFNDDVGSNVDGDNVVDIGFNVVGIVVGCSVLLLLAVFISKLL